MFVVCFDCLHLTPGLISSLVYMVVLPECVSVHYMHGWSPGIQKGAPDLLELEFLTVVRHHMSGIESGFSERAVSALNY